MAQNVEIDPVILIVNYMAMVVQDYKTNIYVYSVYIFEQGFLKLNYFENVNNRHRYLTAQKFSTTTELSNDLKQLKFRCETDIQLLSCILIFVKKEMHFNIMAL